PPRSWLRRKIGRRRRLPPRRRPEAPRSRGLPLEATAERTAARGGRRPRPLPGRRRTRHQTRRLPAACPRPSRRCAPNFPTASVRYRRSRSRYVRLRQRRRAAAAKRSLPEGRESLDLAPPTLRRAP
ncbi:unnamed protein product, partial [Ectocarpus sp. 12 AP-2014]